MVNQILIIRCHDGFDTRRVVTVYDVFVGKQVGCRYRHCANLVQCQDGLPKLNASFKDEHYHISFPDAQRLKE
ncbi:hypothetical protein SDC9_206373 [bioreactor metagenome]|uniref:Uncharacterized protein n=1 Tax=bioreactor metagenome TaxID=1076179 RepID=A0A645J6B8_9ZZZZ